MREILFRGKKKKNGAWVDGNYYKQELFYGDLHEAHFIITSNEALEFDQALDAYEVDPTTVGQYTGLKDKHGKRIFEGDICRNTKTGEIVSVKWHGTMAGFVWNKRKEGHQHLHDFGELFRVYDKYEVIGNIHDNPELIGGGES